MVNKYTYVVIHTYIDCIFVPTLYSVCNNSIFYYTILLLLYIDSSIYTNLKNVIKIKDDKIK